MSTSVQQDTQHSRVPWITKLVFWIAFAALLATSIPHVAWIYQAFEPQGGTILNLWVLRLDVVNLTAYGVAIGIDAMAAWLTYVITLGGKKGSKSLWVFITVLVLFSWYCNYVYAMGHNPDYHGNIWGISLLWGTFTTGDITPILISAIPIMLIAYTVMWQQIAKVDSENPALLAEQAEILEQLNAHKRRIREAKRANRQDIFTGFISDVRDTVLQVGTLAKSTKTVQEHTPHHPTESPTNGVLDGSLIVVPDTVTTVTVDVPTVNTSACVPEPDTETHAAVNEPLQVLRVEPVPLPATNGHAQFIPPYRRNKV